MAGKLIQVSTTTVSSNVSSVAITGIDDDSVYMITVNGLEGTAHDQPARAQVTIGGTGSGASSYNYSQKTMGVAGAFGSRNSQGDTSFHLEFIDENTDQAGHSSIIMCYNFNSTTEGAFITINGVGFPRTSNAYSVTGGGTFTGTGSARDGMTFFQAGGGQIRAGTFTLYKFL